MVKVSQCRSHNQHMHHQHRSSCSAVLCCLAPGTPCARNGVPEGPMCQEPSILLQANKPGTDMQYLAVLSCTGGWDTLHAAHPPAYLCWCDRRCQQRGCARSCWGCLWWRGLPAQSTAAQQPTCHMHGSHCRQQHRRTHPLCATHCVACKKAQNLIQGRMRQKMCSNHTAAYVGSGAGGRPSSFLWSGPKPAWLQGK
jgi:hypothetical protein